MSVLVWAGVVVIGGLGSVLRFLVDRQVTRWATTGFPLGTMAVNLTGSFVLGLIGGLAAAPDVTLLAGTAAVGSYTTFSTWMLETQRLGEERQLSVAGANVVLSVILGVAAAALGRAIGGQL
jgi:fluoride exporter